MTAALATGLRTERHAPAWRPPAGRSLGALSVPLALEPLDWRRVRVTLTDERWVDPGSPDSNEKLVRGRLLQNRAAEASFHPLHGRSPDIETAARRASALLRGWPPFDVVMLGMGDDGHVASLFPGLAPRWPAGLGPQRAHPASPCRPERAARRPRPRLRLTLRPLAAAGPGADPDRRRG